MVMVKKEWVRTMSSTVLKCYLFTSDIPQTVSDSNTKLNCTNINFHISLILKEMYN